MTQFTNECERKIICILSKLTKTNIMNIQVLRKVLIKPITPREDHSQRMRCFLVRLLQRTLEGNSNSQIKTFLRTIQTVSTSGWHVVECKYSYCICNENYKKLQKRLINMSGRKCGSRD